MEAEVDTICLSLRARVLELQSVTWYMPIRLMSVLGQGGLASLCILERSTKETTPKPSIPKLLRLTSRRRLSTVPQRRTIHWCRWTNKYCGVHKVKRACYGDYVYGDH